MRTIYYIFVILNFLIMSNSHPDFFSSQNGECYAHKCQQQQKRKNITSNLFQRKPRVWCSFKCTYFEGVVTHHFSFDTYAMQLM